MADDSSQKTGNIARILIHIACMIVLTLLIIICVFKWMKSYTRHGQYISVPDVSGMFESEAGDILAANGLRYEIASYKYDKEVVEGGIIEQTPKAGANVKQDRTVFLTLNSGKEPMRAIPDLADNSSLRAAESQIWGAGFKLGTTIYIDGDLDWVYEIRYQDKKVEAGTEIPEGSTLTIVAGNGRHVDTIEKADSTGLVDTDFFGD